LDRGNHVAVIYRLFLIFKSLLHAITDGLLHMYGSVPMISKVVLLVNQEKLSGINLLDILMDR
jgi:hypothetical protein